MIPQHRHLQLHLFDTNLDHMAISPEIRHCLLALIIALLNEAVSGEASVQTPAPKIEAGIE